MDQSGFKVGTLAVLVNQRQCTFDNLWVVIIMVNITIIQKDGTNNATECDEGNTLMESIRFANINELQGVCGGFLACAQCHVQLETTCDDMLPPMTETEDGLLDGAENRKPNSRLACQIIIIPELEGARVTLGE